MKIYDRNTGSYLEEREYQSGALKFLYRTIPGRLLLRIAVSPRFSRWRSHYQKSVRSRKDILPFIAEHHIDMTEWDADSFQSFNDFFTRKRHYTTDADPEELIAVADSRLAAFPIGEDLHVSVKGVPYTLSELVDDRISLKQFRNGTCLVFRLAVEDYHRYVFPDDGKLNTSFLIPGVLHTVRPIAGSYRVFRRNTRIVSQMETDHFGPLIQIEVGAMLVGHIVNHPVTRFRRMQEKGYFEFGGSTIILLVPQSVVIDRDIIDQSRMGLECKVQIGEKIGEFYAETSADLL